MAAGLYNIKIEQGATLFRLFKWTDSNNVPKDLTGYTARMQIRPHVSDSTVILELSTANNRIFIDGLTGSIELNVDADTTAALNFESAVYSLELTAPGGYVTRLLEGHVTLSLAVTR